MIIIISVAIYSRKSKETDTGESIKNQIEMCKDYFIHRGIECSFEIFQDEGFSGGNTNRPQFQRMMLLAKHKQFNIIACYKVDRIGRNIVDFMNTFSELEKHDVKLVSVTEGFDPDTPAGRMMMTMIAGFAEMERMNIAQRVKDNMQSLATMGRWSGGTCPTGYKSVRLPNGDKTAMYLELIPEYKNRLVDIFKSIASGMSFKATGNKYDMPGKTINNIIYNPVYCTSDATSKKYLESIGYTICGELNGKGYVPYNRRPKTKQGKKLYNAKGMIAAVSLHEAPIPSDLWIAANEKAKVRGSEKRPRISEYSWLAHMVKCSCGSGMFVFPGNMRKDGSRTYYFRCSNRCGTKWLNAKWAEEDILEWLKEVNKNKGKLKKYLYSNTSRDYDSEIKTIKKEISKNTLTLNKFADKIVLLEGSALQIIVNKMNTLSKKNEDLNNMLLRIERESIIFNNTDNLDIIQNNIDKFILYFDKLNIEEKQLYIKSIFQYIEWNGSELTIHLLQ